MSTEELYNRLNEYLAGNEDARDEELEALLYYLDECRGKACPPDAEKMWARIEEAIARGKQDMQAEERKTVRRKKAVRRLGLWMAAAAIAVPLAVGCWWWLRQPATEKALPVVVTQPREVVLTLASGETVKVQQLQEQATLREGNADIVVDTASFIAYRQTAAAADGEMRYNVLQVPRSSEFQIQLADGTMIWLNSASELRYPVNFSGNERRVFLKGEAYFEVARDTSLPFRVEASGMVVEALGTAFNVNAYGDDGCLRAALAEGKVRVTCEGVRGECILEPGEQAVVHEGQLSVETVDLQDVTAWKEGRFVFTDMPLETIVRQLERWYDVRFDFYDPAAKYYRFTGVTKRHNSLEEVLALLEETTNVQFKIYDSKVEVFRKTSPRLNE